MLLTSTKLVNASLIITQCLNIILRKYASPEDVIVLTTDRPVMNFKVMRLDIRKGKILGDYRTELPKFYVIEISSGAELAAYLKEILNYHETLINLRGKFLFIGENFSYDYYGYILNNNLINSLFFDIERGIIYKVHPYIKGTFRRNGGLLTMLGECGAEFEEYENFYDVNIPRRGEKHEITVGYDEKVNTRYREYVNFSRPGLEVEIIDTILEYLNINHSFIPMNDGLIDEYEFWADLVICGCRISRYFQDEQTASYHFDHTKFLVPVPEQIERWRYILLVFSPICWILFLSALTSILLATFLTKYTYLYSVSKFSIVQVLYVIFLGRTKRFTTKYFSLDILIFCIVFWSVMLNYLFSSKLTYLLNGISYEKSIETTEDIAKNQLFIFTIDESLKRMVKTLPEFRDYPDYLFKPWNKANEYLDDISKRKRVVLLASAEFFRLMKKSYTNRRTGLLYLKELEPPFLTFFIGARFKRGHPFFDYFNRHVQYFIESGLARKIIEYYEAPKWEQPTMEPTQKLKMKHIQAPLMILAVGLMLSLLVFFFELTKWKYTTRSTR